MSKDTDAEVVRGAQRLEARVDVHSAAYSKAAAADRAAVAGAINLPEVKALNAYQEGVLYRVPGYTADSDHERALIVALCRAIIDNPDLRLEALGGSRFRVDDAAPARKLREAREALHEAARERDDFLKAHADDFERIREEEKVRSFKAALDSADLDALRAQLGLGGKAMTTADLASA